MKSCAIGRTGGKVETMKIYLVQIGNLNAQHNYKVKASSEKAAKQIALNRHKELGRSISDSDNVYIKRIG